MERLLHASGRRRWALAPAALLLAVAVLSGCGGKKASYKNEPRPPSAIVLTASIGKDRVSVSPARFGAGPIDLIITNQSGSQQIVTFRSASGDPEQKTGPLNPSDTATLKLDVPQGKAMVKVDGGGIRRAELSVGPKRPTSQDKLLLP